MAERTPVFIESLIPTLPSRERRGLDCNGLCTQKERCDFNGFLLNYHFLSTPPASTLNHPTSPHPTSTTILQSRCSIPVSRRKDEEWNPHAPHFILLSKRFFISEMLYLALRVRAGCSISIPIYIYCYVQSVSQYKYVLFPYICNVCTLKLKFKCSMVFVLIARLQTLKNNINLLIRKCAKSKINIMENNYIEWIKTKGNLYSEVPSHSNDNVVINLI